MLMIVGVGVDITEIKRMANIISSKPGFVNKVLSDEEIAVFETLKPKQQSVFLAGRFSVKESFAKALGTGIGSQVKFKDITVLNDKLGKPIIKQAIFEGNVHMSISHTDVLALTEVVLEKEV